MSLMLQPSKVYFCPSSGATTPNLQFLAPCQKDQKDDGSSALLLVHLSSSAVCRCSQHPPCYEKTPQSFQKTLQSGRKNLTWKRRPTSSLFHPVGSCSLVVTHWELWWAVGAEDPALSVNFEPACVSRAHLVSRRRRSSSG